MSEKAGPSPESRDSQKRPVTDITKDVRGILADMSVAEKHPITLEKPDKEAPQVQKAMHLVHLALFRAGQLANRNYERKIPDWPLPPHSPENVSVMSYGVEKISYKIYLDTGKKVKLAVFHREALHGDMHEVAEKKKEHYDTYVKYFGDLVVPTMFLEVDNPWGEGKKPAILQEYLPDLVEFTSLSRDELLEKAKVDAEFAASLQKLIAGYHAMLEDGLCPDFASSNVLITDSQIVLPDTGLYYSRERLEQLKSINPGYQLIESLKQEQF